MKGIEHKRGKSRRVYWLLWKHHTGVSRARGAKRARDDAEEAKLAKETRAF